MIKHDFFLTLVQSVQVDTGTNTLAPNRITLTVIVVVIYSMYGTFYELFPDLPQGSRYSTGTVFTFSLKKFIK